ncbi:MAG: 2OG-Fe(II) oxygenase [Pseudomonadota bacterium]
MAETADRFDAAWEAAQAGDADAQLALGRHYLAADDFGRARRWFGRAARAGQAAGYTELALLELQGLGMAEDAAGAREHFMAGIAAGDARARYELALIDYRTGRRPATECLEALAEAARGGYAPAQREVGVLLLAENDVAARGALKLAARANDMLAISTLLCLAQTDGDTALAGDLTRRGRELGSYCAERFGTEPTGAVLDALETPLTAAAIPAPTAAAASAPVPERPLGDDRVRVYDDMLSAIECRYLIEVTAPQLRPSHTVHPETGESVRNDMRTSYGYSLHPLQEDFVILGAKARLAAETGFPVGHAEPFALLRYEPGQEYKPHFDYIDPASGEAGQELATRGQREVTIFSYLTSVAGGGETVFPRLDVQVACRAGRALMFRNTRPDGAPDPESLHASLPVESGEKWIATLWIRGRTLLS